MIRHLSNVREFRPIKVEGHAPSTGASSKDALLGRLRMLLGRFLGRVGAPGLVQSGEIRDAVSGQKIEIAVGLLFTRISIDGRDYYFRRLTGRFDGTGQGCC